MSFQTEPMSIEELADRLDSDRIDWERPHRAHAYRPSRRTNRTGL